MTNHPRISDGGEGCQPMNNDQFLRRLARHCVAVVWEDRAANERRQSDGIAFSAFIMSVQGLWFLVSAGHIIEAIRKRQAQNGRIYMRGQIVDSWSEGAVTKGGIAFPELATCPQWHVDDDELGFDYCWFYLRPYYRKSLSANGIIALSEATWAEPPEQFDGFNCFGFPGENIHPRHDREGNYCGLRVKPRVVPYCQVSDPPSELQTQYPRIFFRPLQSEAGDVVSLKGMSGGPIFGYTRQGNGLRLWLVAIQSAQATKSGLAIGCPTGPFARSIDAAIRQAINDGRLANAT